MIRSDRFAFVFCFQHTRLFLPHPTCFVFNMHVLSHVLSFSASYIHVLFSTCMDSCFYLTCFVFNMHVAVLCSIRALFSTCTSCSSHSSYIHVLFSTYMNSYCLSNVLCFQHARRYSLFPYMVIVNSLPQDGGYSRRNSATKSHTGGEAHVKIDLKMCVFSRCVTTHLESTPYCECNSRASPTR